MVTPIPTRFSDEDLTLIDTLVTSGLAETRSAVIRLAVHRLADSQRRDTIGREIANSYRQQPQTPEDDELAMASAVALTEAESW